MVKKNMKFENKAKHESCNFIYWISNGTLESTKLELRRESRGKNVSAAKRK